MCGICGIVDGRGIERDRLARMSAAIAHRGPDDAGEHVDGPVGLAARRLAIIDPERGAQPVYNEDRSVVAVHNGEIYSGAELRAGLESRGHRLRSESDAEVLVHLYEEHGDDLVRFLDGMFAFAIWDARRRRLLLARDRLGQKPLYWTRDGGALLFASEPKSLIAALPASPEPDLRALGEFLSLRFVPAPRSLFDGVRKIPPAHVAVFEDGDLVTRRYWDVSFREKLPLSDDEAVEAVGEAIDAAVSSHLVSDVPVGALLSGGMDSSLVVASMAGAGLEPLRTFAIGADDETFDERGAARVVSERFGTRHVDEVIGAEILGELPRIVYHLDEPSDPIALCMYSAARLAARHVKVVLGGDGGDELFGGFDRYAGISRLARFPRLLRTRLLAPLLRAVPEGYGYKSLGQKAHWLASLLGEESVPGMFARATSHFRFGEQDKRWLLGPRAFVHPEGERSEDAMRRAWLDERAEHPLDRMLAADLTTRLPEHSLMLADRMSMAHGLEARSPLLDHRLVELAARLPVRMKIRPGALKWVLRKLALERLPAEIAARPKQGFMFPLARWLDGPLAGPVRRLSAQSTLVREGLLAPGAVERLLEEHRGGRRDHHVRIWMVLNLEIWARLYIDRVTPGDLEALVKEASRVGGSAP